MLGIKLGSATQKASSPITSRFKFKVLWIFFLFRKDKFQTGGMLARCEFQGVGDPSILFRMSGEGSDFKQGLNGVDPAHQGCGFPGGPTSHRKQFPPVPH